MQNTMNQVTRALIEDDLIRHEGYVQRIYLDHLGYRTFGIGHLVTKNDPEWTWPTDTPVDKVRIEQAFKKDLDDAILDTEQMFPDLYSHPENVVRVLVNMMFNLGYPKFKKFKKMRAAVEAKDYTKASEEMKDSLWYTQVGRRSKELCRLMEWAVADVPQGETKEG